MICTKQIVLNHKLKNQKKVLEEMHPKQGKDLGDKPTSISIVYISIDFLPISSKLKSSPTSFFGHNKANCRANGIGCEWKLILVIIIPSMYMKLQKYLRAN